MSELTASPLDTRRFGIVTHRARIEHTNEIPRLLENVERHRTELLIVRIPTSSIECVQILGSEGFLLADTLVYYRGPTNGFEELEPERLGFQLRRAMQGDLDELRALVRACFVGFRGHYHTDSRLDAEAATEGYVEWCARSVIDPQEWVFVAQSGDELAGFLTVRGDEILLNGVHPDYQRHGIYGALVDRAGAELRKAGIPSVCSSTQIDNLGPQRVWSRRGLTPYRSDYTLHAWFDRSGEGR